MQISTRDWKNYINKLSRLNKKASEEMQRYVARNGFADTDALIDFCYAIVTKYGEGSAELACQMYDAMAEMANAAVDAAVPAATATYAETARAIQGSLLQSPTGQKLTQVANRLVKQAAADTTLQNAIRDNAQWAWIPSGDTCGFCITLASNGWQRASKRVLRGNHATHIHANCDCMFAIRFSENDNVKGYDPDYYKKLYDEAPGGSSSEKVKALRRQLEDRDKINAQKRENYQKNKIAKIKQKAPEISKVYNISPGQGKLTLKDAYSKDDIMDNKMAEWLHAKIGGEIQTLPEVAQIGKNVDAIWNGDLWEFKAPTTKNAIDDRLRKANKQILEAQKRNNDIGRQSGVVLDISKCNLDEEEAINTIIQRAQSRLQNNTLIIIKNGNNIVTDYLVKK